MTQEQQFLQLMNTHSSLVWKVIRLYEIDGEAQRDLLQEITLQAWQSFPRFRAESKFSTWLYRVAVNTALTYRRNSQKRALAEKAHQPETETAIQQEEEYAMLLHAIRQLPEADRILISLYLDDVSHQEIADITGITANHVGVKLFRIRQQLFNMLKTEL